LLTKPKVQPRAFANSFSRIRFINRFDLYSSMMLMLLPPLLVIVKAQKEEGRFSTILLWLSIFFSVQTLAIYYYTI
jgi:hypothetical protein